jgi:hypothetical protein
MPRQWRRGAALAEAVPALYEVKGSLKKKPKTYSLRDLTTHSLQ